MKDESEVQQNMSLEAAFYNCIVMRNNQGACIDETGRLVRYGLGNVSKARTERIASSDLIGITKVVITPDMVGKTVGIFTALEIKKEDWKHNKKLDKRETAQYAFIKWVKSLGGYAGFCSDSESLKEIFK